MEHTALKSESCTAIAVGEVVVYLAVTHHHIRAIADIECPRTIRRFGFKIAVGHINSLQYHGLSTLNPNNVLQVAVIGFAVGVLVARENGRGSRRIGHRRSGSTLQTGRITADERYGRLDGIDVGVADGCIDSACEMEHIACFRHTAGKHFLEIGGAKRTFPRLTVALGGGKVGTYEPRSGGHLSGKEQDER